MPFKLIVSSDGLDGLIRNVLFTGDHLCLELKNMLLKNGI